jgi:hypothetical protein
MMAGPIPSLVLARLRRRGSTALIAIAALAAATALVAIVSGIGLVAADATVQRTLDKTGADRPVVRVSRFSPTSTDFAEADATARAAFQSHVGDITGPLVAGFLGSELGDLKAPVFEQIVAVDDPASLVTLTEGRLPAHCVDGARCEALLLSEVPADPEFIVARPAPGVELTIVGRGLIDPAVPFGDIDQRGAFGQKQVGGGEYQNSRSSPSVLLVDGLDAIARLPVFDHSGRTYLWTAPLRVDAIHPWTTDAVADDVDTLTRDLAAADPAYTVQSPMPSIEAALSRADAGRGRLLVIGSLGVAILLAFAVFLALVVREDTAAEVARLSAVGARRRDRIAFLLLEAMIPAVIGGIIGWAIGALVVAVLATWSGVAVAPILAGALLGPVPLATALAVIAVAVLATALATAPGLPRAGAFRGAVALALTVAVLMIWQLATSGPLDAATLASSIASPIVVLLPPALAFLAAMVLTTAMPPILRAVSRRAGRTPLPLRLSLLSIAREPGRPAATMTLLAFSLGAIVFAIGWSASLRQGIEDAAAYRTGLDLRVSELGTALSISKSVVPVSRYERLGADVRAIPVYRDASTTQPGAAVDLLGIDPAALPTLPGWRADFSATPVTELAQRLEVPAPPGGWHVGGHRLPAGETQLVVRFKYEGDPVRLDAVVRTDGGDAVILPLGTIVDGMSSASARLPDSAIGGTLTTLIFRNDALVAGSQHQHGVFAGTVTFSGLDGLVDAKPIPIEIFTVSSVIVRAPQVTDDLVLPAIVSPDLAREAAADGTLALHIGDGQVPIRVAGTADRAPTVLDPKPRFAILPLDPFLVALASALPAGGRPTEMWVSAPTPQRLAEVRDALHLAPFRFADVTARADLVAERAADPLSQAIVWALLVAAIAGLALSIGGLVLGAVTDLRDERGELADLEAQGVAPSSLRWHALARTAWLAIGGAIAGLAAGILLAAVATGALAVDAEGRVPIPPLLVVLPPLPIIGVVAGVVAVVLGLVAWLARQTYGRATLGERRGGPGAALPAAGWHRGAEHVDG